MQQHNTIGCLLFVCVTLPVFQHFNKIRRVRYNIAVGHTRPPRQCPLNDRALTQVGLTAVYPQYNVTFELNYVTSLYTVSALTIMFCPLIYATDAKRTYPLFVNIVLSSSFRPTLIHNIYYWSCHVPIIELKPYVVNSHQYFWSMAAIFYLLRNLT